jgi:uncharacterized repeat protein (TIGR03803 family)
MKKILPVFVVIVFTFLNNSFLSAQGQVWGLTSSGGDNNSGVLFKANGDGTNFQVKKSLYAGDNPYGSLKEINGKFYYTTSGNGYYGGGIFSYDVGNNSLTAVDGLTHFTSYPSAGSIPLGSLLQFNGSMYGMTTDGGSQSCNGGTGVIFETNPTANFGGATPHTRVKSYNLNGGAKPSGSLVFFNGLFYGLTGQCGANSGGTLFSVSTDFSTTPITLVNFGGSIGSSNPGALPQGSLTVATNGKLYGLASRGGASDLGTLFEYSTSLTKRVDFNGSNGAQPCGSLIQAANGKLYGMTKLGGAYNAGTIFEFDPVSNILIKKYDFSATNGQNPVGTLMQAPNGKLYGMTTLGGANNLGVLFEFDPTNSAYTKRVDFNGANGSYPQYTALLFRKDDQTITFNTLPAKSIGCTSFQAGASASSGLQISYTSSNPSVATVSSTGMITIVGLGSTTITASQNGNSYYNPAASVSQVLNVGNKPGVSNIFTGPDSYTTCGMTTSFNAAFGSGSYTWTLPSGETVISGGNSSSNYVQLQWNSLGDKLISVYVTDANGCPSETAQTPYSVTSRGNQAISGLPTQTGLLKTFGDAPFQLPGVSSSGNQLTWNFSSGSNDILAIGANNVATVMNAGSSYYTVSANQTACYYSASQLMTVIVQKGTQTISCVQPQTTYCDEVIVNVTSSAGIPVFVNNYSGSITSIGNNNFKVTSTGSFDFKSTNLRNYTDAYGCAFQVYINKTPYSSIFANGQTNLCNGQATAQLMMNNIQNVGNGGPVTLQWLKNGTDIVGANQSSYSASQTGNYQVKLTQNNCQSLTNSIYVDAAQCEDFSLYPNPSVNTFRIEISKPAASDQYFYVYDWMGQFYTFYQILEGETYIDVDCSGFENGLYKVSGYFRPYYINKSFSVSH